MIFLNLILLITMISCQNNNEDENIASDRTRNRFRIRLRWGFEKDYGDDYKEHL